MNAVIAVAAFAAIALTATAAAVAGTSQAQRQYQRDRAACMSGASNQDRATCLKEAGAALAEAKRGGLGSGDLARNRTARCDGLPAADRDDCILRMNAGTTTGSSQQGGILREATRPSKP